MVLTTVLLLDSTVALPVDTGTESPTCSVADWLSTTTNDGLDRTLTVVTVCSASRIRLGWVSEPIRKLKPGKARLMNALDTEPATEATPVVALVTVWGAAAAWVFRIEPVFGLSPMFWLVRYDCTP